MSRLRALYRTLAVVGALSAAVGVVLLVGSGGGMAALASADVLGSAFVAVAVMALAAGALLRAGQR